MSEPRLLRPLGYLDYLNEAFHLYKQNALLLVGVSGTALLPYFALAVFLWGDRNALGLWALGLPLLAPFLHGAIVRAALDGYLGMRTSIARSWWAVLRCLIPFGLTSTLAGIGFLICLLPKWIPAIIFYFWSFFLCHVMVAEGTYYVGAFRRSRELAGDHWLRVAFVTLLMAILLGAMPAFFLIEARGPIGARPRPSAPITAPSVDREPTVLDDDRSTGHGRSTWELLAALLIVGTMLSATVPLATVLSVILYVDLRVRKEGFDIEWVTRSAQR